MNRIENGTSPRNGKKEVGRSALAPTGSQAITIAQPSNVDLEQVVNIGQIRADQLLDKIQKIVNRAGCEVEIINDIQLVESADGSRTLVMKRTTRFQKDPI